MKHGAAIGLDHFTPGHKQVLDIINLDPPPADLDLDPRGGACKPPRPNSRVHTLCTLALATSSARSIASRTEWSSGLHVGHVAALDPLKTGGGLNPSTTIIARLGQPRDLVADTRNEPRLTAAETLSWSGGAAMTLIWSCAVFGRGSLG